MARLIEPETTSMASRAALYLRVSTGCQAESDLSIPDQRRQMEAYCAGKGWSLGVVFVEPGNTATDGKRPAFQAMMDAVLSKPAPFDAISQTPVPFHVIARDWLAPACWP